MLDLVGTTEAAKILGVSRQRVNQLAKKPNFPKPLAILAMGPVYSGTDVRAFEANRLAIGRPRSKDPEVAKRAERCICDHDKRSHTYEPGFYGVRGGHGACEVVGCLCKSYSLRYFDE